MKPSQDRPTKAALRQRLRQQLAALDSAVRHQAAERVAALVESLPQVANAKNVFTCLSFGGEIETWSLAEKLVASGRRVYVPRAVVPGRALHLHRFPCEVETLSFGLRQPLASEPELPADQIDQQIDVALILGLGFDRAGNRLGYGAGYFDRFLSNRPFPAIGLAFQVQLLDGLPVEAHDVPMDAVVTEEGVFGGSGSG